MDRVKPGRKLNPRAQAYMLRFGVHYRKVSRNLPKELLDQLDACKDDEARRLLLGVSKEAE